jgi:hypothetical protein
MCAAAVSQFRRLQGAAIRQRSHSTINPMLAPLQTFEQDWSRLRRRR